MSATLVQILLPLSDNEGRPFPGSAYAGVRDELAGTFGGVTAYSRGPAEGVWQDGKGRSHDDIVVFEVMCDDLDPAWWARYRRELEARFRQDSIVVRAQAIRLL
ncbi:conserved hypothetical protein [Methylobacterium sp. 4-46]|uniref:hypothetical protein n=1 Tax=unclassified Methylobacterium TaxID=2615210 RepID=UPI000152DC15|nr:MULTISPECIES: hypothetical protein [Methylobacterium]ACA18158.1 conserved hypothetical protein [Methylobacterium sp. 4-46]WFT77455.1 hypothetical protein QA634_19160 [Methylobacterium nodulans]